MIHFSGLALGHQNTEMSTRHKAETRALIGGGGGGRGIFIYSCSALSINGSPDYSVHCKRKMLPSSQKVTLSDNWQSFVSVMIV